jgi:hypothetical protein
MGDRHRWIHEYDGTVNLHFHNKLYGAQSAQLAKKLPFFYLPRRLILCSQESAVGFVINELNSLNISTPYFSKGRFNIILPSTLSLQMVCLQVFGLKCWIHFSYLPHEAHAVPIIFMYVKNKRQLTVGSICTAVHPCRTGSENTVHALKRKFT